ncbi:MAG: hypothetical protein GWO44_03300, partial [Thermoplasmata archaeon]|nr:hypothetical protein [Thermoplasmata archaeon]NIY02319.1 hypothetical protein [Thermoplasmata archaeon]
EIAAEAAFMRALQEVLALANRMASDEGVGMEPATTISASMSAQLTSVGQPETA